MVRTAHTLNKTITDTYVPLLSDATFEGEAVPPPAKIPWCVRSLLSILPVDSSPYVRVQVPGRPWLAIQHFQEGPAEIARVQKISFVFGV